MVSFNGQDLKLSYTGGGGNDLVLSVVSTENDVPTLSQWGLINLTLLLMTFGTIYIINPNFSLRKQINR